MAQTIIDNINSILNTKSELQTILVENGQEGGDVFSQYPEQFRAAIQTAASSGMNEEQIVSYISSYLSAYNFIDQAKLSSNSYLTSVPSGYATEQYVDDAIDAIEFPTPDLSSYVTKTELSNQSYLTSIPSEYITQNELSACGYITSIPSEYITQTELSNCGYITANDIPSTDLSGCLLSPTISGYTGQQRMYDDGIGVNALNGVISPNNYSYETSKTGHSNGWCGIGTMKNYVEGRLSDIESSYVSKSELSSCGYITINDVPAPDLSGYVTKTELSSQSYLTSIPSEYITQTELSSNGYLTSVPNTYPTYTAISNMGYVTTSVNNLSNYYTKTNINNASYVSKTQVNGMFSYDSSTGILTITTIS